MLHSEGEKCDDRYKGQSSFLLQVRLRHVNHIDCACGVVVAGRRWLGILSSARLGEIDLMALLDVAQELSLDDEGEENIDQQHEGKIGQMLADRGLPLRRPVVGISRPAGQSFDSEVSASRRVIATLDSPEGGAGLQSSEPPVLSAWAWEGTPGHSMKGTYGSGTIQCFEVSGFLSDGLNESVVDWP
jgi:hypothetical protein